MDPTQERILLDLTKDYRDKIRYAAAHLNEMCAAANIPDEKMLAAVTGATLYFLVETIDLHTSMSAEDFAETCADTLQQRRITTRRARQSRS
jgi:hypothetical protein